MTTATPPIGKTAPALGPDEPPAEPFAFALVTWPAAAMAVQLSAADDFWWRIAALLWLTAFHLAAYGNQRGAAFGNITLLTSTIVAGAWALFPSPWAFAALPLLLIGLHGGQRALLRPRNEDCRRDAKPRDAVSRDEHEPGRQHIFGG